MKNLIDKVERERISALCDYYKIKNYTINADGTVDVDGDVVLLAKGFTELPIRFNKVSGKFTCNNNKLTTLYGCPIEVGGDFGCNKSSLTSLKFGPQKVGGYYSCPSNRLTSFEYAPTEIGGHFNAYRNRVTSLVGCPTKVGGYFDVHNNKLTSLEGAPKEIAGELNFYDNKIVDCFITVIFCIFFFLLGGYNEIVIIIYSRYFASYFNIGENILLIGLVDYRSSWKTYINCFI
jgi:hypothetical protein